MALIETGEGRPILHSYRHALPGDPDVPLFKLHVFDRREESFEEHESVGLFVEMLENSAGGLGLSRRKK